MTNHENVTGAFDVHSKCFPWLSKETQRSKGVFFFFLNNFEECILSRLSGKRGG